MCICKAFEDVWAYFYPSKPYVLLSTEGKANSIQGKAISIGLALIIFFGMSVAGLRQTVHLRHAEHAEALGLPLHTAQAKIRCAQLYVQRDGLRVR